MSQTDAFVLELPNSGLADYQTDGEAVREELIPGPADQARSTEAPPRPAWIEIDLKRLRANFGLIRQALPEGVGLLSVIKDEAYGHGAIQLARAALEAGAKWLAVSTPGRARLEIQPPLRLLGEK